MTMNRILVNVFVPIIGESFDIFVPTNVQLYDVLELIKKAVISMSDGRFFQNEKTVLCTKESGIILDINKTLNELGISNGSRLMLI